MATKYKSKLVFDSSTNPYVDGRSFVDCEIDVQSFTEFFDCSFVSCKLESRGLQLHCCKLEKTEINIGHGVKNEISHCSFVDGAVVSLNERVDFWMTTLVGTFVKLPNGRMDFTVLDECEVELSKDIEWGRPKEAKDIIYKGIPSEIMRYIMNERGKTSSEYPPYKITWSHTESMESAEAEIDMYVDGFRDESHISMYLPFPCWGMDMAERGHFYFYLYAPDGGLFDKDAIAEWLAQRYGKLENY